MLHVFVQKHATLFSHVLADFKKSFFNFPRNFTNRLFMLRFYDPKHATSPLYRGTRFARPANAGGVNKSRARRPRPRPSARPKAIQRGSPAGPPQPLTLQRNVIASGSSGAGRLGRPFRRQRMTLQQAGGTRKHFGRSLGCRPPSVLLR